MRCWAIFVVITSIGSLRAQTALPRADQTKPACNVFSGSVKAEFLEDGRRMRLLEKFIYVDPFCKSWSAPIGAVVDGASIPRIAWSVIGGPFEGKYRDASVIHDVACIEKKSTWQDVHLVFYYAMLARNVESWRAKVMYAAVYHFGPRWFPPNAKGGIIEPRTLNEQDFEKLKKVIQAREQQFAKGGKAGPAAAMTLEEIRSFKP